MPLTILQVHECLGCAMAVLHADDVRFLDQFTENGYWNREFMIVGIVVMRIVRGKQVGDVMVKQPRPDGVKLVIRHAQQDAIQPRS